MHNEFENRRFLDNNRQHHFITHSRIHYKILPNIEIAAGFCFSRQSPQNQYSTTSLVVPEYRLEQEFSVQNQVSKRISIHNRLRVDERYITKNNGLSLSDGFDFNFRFRHRIQVILSLNKPESNLPLLFKAGNEVMINSGKTILYNHFDQSRLLLSFEKSLNRNFSAEIGYIHWYQQRPSGNEFFNRNILRLTLLHKIELAKAKDS